MSSAICLISAPDQEGLVYAITRFIYNNKGNILHAEQHIDAEQKLFFMRIEWDLKMFSIQRNFILESLKPLEMEWNMHIQVLFKDHPLKTALFVSKTDHCLYEILLKSRSGELNIVPKLIISNHYEAQEIAEAFNIPFYHFAVFQENKRETERQQIDLLQRENIKLIVLARYMQILSPEFIQEFPAKIINVHHSFLPAFAGADPYRQAYARGVKLIGSTAHYVTEILDDGPIIHQRVTTISHRDNIHDLRQKGNDLEKLVLTEAVKKHAEHKVLVFNGKTMVFD